MRNATDAEVEAACMYRSAIDARRMLNADGIFVSPHRCHSAIKRLIEAGQRDVMMPGKFVAPTHDLTPASASVACRALLRRMLTADQHCISDPAKMATALREAGMVP